ncbi:MAG: flagellar hook-length control protein FliK [Pseudomonadota bacterium]
MIGLEGFGPQTADAAPRKPAPQTQNSDEPETGTAKAGRDRPREDGRATAPANDHSPDETGSAKRAGQSETSAQADRPGDRATREEAAESFATVLSDLDQPETLAPAPIVAAQAEPISAAQAPVPAQQTTAEVTPALGVASVIAAAAPVTALAEEAALPQPAAPQVLRSTRPTAPALAAPVAAPVTAEVPVLPVERVTPAPQAAVTTTGTIQQPATPQVDAQRPTSTNVTPKLDSALPQIGEAQGIEPEITLDPRIGLETRGQERLGPETAAARQATLQGPAVLGPQLPKSAVETIATPLDLATTGEIGIESNPSSGTDRTRPSAFATLVLSPASPPPQQAAAISAQMVGTLARTGADRIEIRLDPPELGRVALTMTITEQAVSALVSAERPEITDLMRRHADQLQRDLAEAGFGDVDLQFSDGQQAGDGSDDDRGEPSAPFGKADLAIGGDLKAPQALSVADGRLDMRI